MDWTAKKEIILRNIKYITSSRKISQDRLNRLVYGETPGGTPKNNLWRSDQNKMPVYDLLRVSEILNVSVERILTDAVQLKPEDNDIKIPKQEQEVKMDRKAWNEILEQMRYLREENEALKAQARAAVNTSKKTR